jgi:hypothetical protein
VKRPHREEIKENVERSGKRTKEIPSHLASAYAHVD